MQRWNNCSKACKTYEINEFKSITKKLCNSLLNEFSPIMKLIKDTFEIEINKNTIIHNDFIY